MKTTLLSALFCLATIFSFGQIETTVEGAVHDASTTYTYTSDTGTISVNINVANISGGTLNLNVRRVIMTTIPSWEDDICWGVGINGQCYFGIQATNPYTTPAPASIDTVDATLLIKISPKDPDYGCGEYRYYIENGSTVLDSISVTVCKTASVDELSPLSISVAPNPASSYFEVKTNDVVGATVQVVDVLGNVVLKETVMGSSKTINTSNFRNGVYFVRVTADNQRPINRRVIVRH